MILNIHTVQVSMAADEKPKDQRYYDEQRQYIANSVPCIQHWRLFVHFEVGIPLCKLRKRWVLKRNILVTHGEFCEKAFYCDTNYNDESVNDDYDCVFI